MEVEAENSCLRGGAGRMTVNHMGQLPPPLPWCLGCFNAVKKANLVFLNGRIVTLKKLYENHFVIFDIIIIKMIITPKD